MSTFNRFSKLFALGAFSLSLGLASPASAASLEQFVNDASITTKVKHAIFIDPELKLFQVHGFFQVHVSTNENVVLIKGTVNTEAQESEVMKVAAQVAGVSSVINNLNLDLSNEVAQDE